MNTKTVIQLFIFFIIIVFLFFFIRNTFYLNRNQITEISESESEIFEETSESLDEGKKNFIQNLTYSTIDSEGNKFNLNAETGEENPEDPNILILNNVTGKIQLKDKSEIIIESDYATYNSNSFDTEFYQNVIILYEEKKFNSDNLDLLFKNNKAIIYNNVKYFDNKIISTADEVEFDLIKGDINIKMFDKKEKVKILKNK